MKSIATVLLLLSAACSWLSAADLHGFIDVRGGGRIYTDATQRDTSLAETRLQLQWEKRGALGDIRLRTDLVYDDLAADHEIDLETGQGWLDLREAYVFLFPAVWSDVKAGRQILTWGTGDLLFVNDLFPKDWRSFFSGRDEEYLKAPSDALMVSLFPAWFNLDLVYMPRFDADRYIRGERISYYNPMTGAIAGREAIIEPLRPDDAFSDDESALRLYRNIGGTELALYGYDGYWKSPEGFDAALQRAIFPRLRVWGASARMPRAGGILSLEAGYYDSLDNRDGENPRLPNSEVRFLSGWERELVRNLTMGLQYYLEYMQDYSAYRANLPVEAPQKDEDRHVVTLRLTRLAMNQKLQLSGFVYYSPTDRDGYLRCSAQYTVNDNWAAAVGGNLFAGDDRHTFFGQFEDNSNLYASLRYSF